MVLSHFAPKRDRVDEESRKATEARLAALFHGGLGERVRNIFESTGIRERWPPVDATVLSLAIAKLYESFGHRRLSRPFQYCEHCISESMAARWERSTLKSLTADDLWEVMSNVPATAGTAMDVLYFAPRLLEHAVTQECVVDLSWAFSSLQRDDAPRTTSSEKAALRDFFEPIWLGLRERDPIWPL